MLNAVSETDTAPVPEQPVAAPPKKKGLPIWVVVLVLAVALGGIYQVYTTKLADKPPVVVKPVKGERPAPGPGPAKPGAKPGKAPPNVKPGTHPSAPAASAGD
jgi:hypothetical protein